MPADPYPPCVESQYQWVECFFADPRNFTPVIRRLKWTEAQRQRSAPAVNKVPGKNLINRLSPLQAAVLAALPRREQPIKIAEIFARLGVTRPTASQRAAMSRSLVRLAARGLVEQWVAQRVLPGHGSRWRKV